jgi:hypothetical protein
LVCIHHGCAGSKVVVAVGGTVEVVVVAAVVVVVLVAVVVVERAVVVVGCVEVGAAVESSPEHAASVAAIGAAPAPSNDHRTRSRRLMPSLPLPVPMHEVSRAPVERMGWVAWGVG